jgi:hypothetical protein
LFDFLQLFGSIDLEIGACYILIERRRLTLNAFGMNDQPKIQVLTAGGAGTHTKPPKSKNVHKKDRRKQKKEVESDPESHEKAAALQNVEPLMSQHEGQLEYEQHHEDDVEDVALNDETDDRINKNNNKSNGPRARYLDNVSSKRSSYSNLPPKSSSVSATASGGGTSDIVWLVICFFGIMASFVCYGLLLEYTTSGGRKLHELSFLFITSGLYTVTAAAGRYVRDETPTTIPPRQFALLGLTSMGSTWCSVRSLR